MREYDGTENPGIPWCEDGTGVFVAGLLAVGLGTYSAVRIRRRRRAVDVRPTAT